jgi:tetratricopeptide (TPR) repeat protein
VALVALAAITTWSRGRVWKDDLTLWSDTVQKAPSAGLAWTELGNSYLRTGQAPAQALEAFKRAVSADNDPLGRAIAYNSMGVVYARLGEEAEARKAWNAAVAEGAGYATAPYNLANHLAQQFERRARGGQDADVSLLEEARSHLNRAVELDPRYEKAWLRLVWCDVYRGIGLLASGNRPAALAELATARQDRQRFQEQLPASPLLREADRLIAHGESQLARGSGGSAGPPIRGQGR